jgi:hypothetical protein
MEHMVTGIDIGKKNMTATVAGNTTVTLILSQEGDPNAKP